MATLAEMLFFSAGITRKMNLRGKDFYMRAASATGALYHIESYVVNGCVDGLEPGVYHFNPLDFALVELRKGDLRPELAAASSDSVKTAPATLAFTSLAWRNAWKYQARSYRHWFWDSGVIAANLLAVSASEGLSPKLMLGFIDDEVNRLLCLEDGKEATIALSPIGSGGAPSPDRKPGPFPEVRTEIQPLSKHEARYPEIWEAYDCSKLGDEAEVVAWLKARMADDGRVEATSGIGLNALGGRKSPLLLEETILRRGSTRRFARLPISFEELSLIVEYSSGSIPFDFLTPRSLVEVYLIVNAVTGLTPGAYNYDRGSRSLVLLKEGDFRSVSSYLCLEQPLFGDASAVFYLMSDLTQVLNALGNRGYRAAQSAAGVSAGRIYLAAYSLGLGASGSTFYDDAVTEFFSPHSKGRSTMIAVGVGRPAYKAKSGSILPQLRQRSDPR